MNEDLFSSENIIDGGVELFGFDEQDLENPDEVNDPENPDDETTPPAEDEITEDDLFNDDEDEDEEDEEEEDDENPESVGKEKQGKQKANKEGAEPEGKGSSPKGYNPYSSFAQALYGDGLFQSLNEDTVKGIKDADAFADAIEAEVNARVDEKTRRVSEALESGISVSQVAQYENTMARLNGITDEMLSEESEKGKNLRIAILKQDYFNKKFSEQRANREIKRILDDKTDIEDAKDALESVKEFYETQYEELVEKNKAEAKADREKTKQQAAEFKKAVLETEKVLGGIEVDKATRRKAYELMTKIVKTTDEGEQLTAVQLYADEHPVEFRTMLGIVAALTDGFTKPSNLLKKTVDKKVRSNLKDIERRLSGTNSHRGGTISFAEGEDDEPEVRSRRWLDI